MPNPTNTTVLQLPTTTTAPSIDNNNNITAEDDNHNTTVLPPSKTSTVPTFNSNYYQGLFDDDDFDDFDNDNNDDERPLTQFDSALPSTHNFQHPPKRTINNNIIPTAAHQHSNNKNTTNPTTFMTVPPHVDTTSLCPNYKDNHDTTTTTTPPNNKSILDMSAYHNSNNTNSHPSHYHPPTTADNDVPHNTTTTNSNNYQNYYNTPTHNNNNHHFNEFANHKSMKSNIHPSDHQPPTKVLNAITHNPISQHHHSHAHQPQQEYQSDKYQHAINQLTSVTIQTDNEIGMSIHKQGTAMSTQTHPSNPNQQPNLPTFINRHTCNQHQLNYNTQSFQNIDDDDDNSHSSFVLQTQDSEITNVSTNQLAHPDTINPTVTSSNPTYHPPLTSKFTTEQAQKLMINYNNNHDLQQRFHLEGRSFIYEIAIKRKFVLLKFYIPLSTATDIPPTYLTIENLAYALIQQCKFNFDVDITALLNFNEAVKTKKGDIYITYVFLSPRSTQHPSYNTYSTNYLILHSRLMDQLRQPSPTYRSNTNLPSHIKQYNINIPHINDITEKLAYFIAGFPPQFLLGNQMHINIDNLRMAGLMLHRAICEQLGQNLTNTFPQPTSRFATSN
jgi:hypothetical protein